MVVSVPADVVLTHEIAQFLYEEAAMLDERRFHDWLELLTDDMHYWMPIRSTRALGDEASEFTAEHENAYFDDDKAMLVQRVAKLDTGFAWAEDPPSRTRHIVTNLRVYQTEDTTEVLAKLDFIVYRSRLAVDEDLWIGAREDTLRRVDGRWKIARRHIFIDQTTLKSKNLSNFL